MKKHQTRFKQLLHHWTLAMCAMSLSLLSVTQMTGLANGLIPHTQVTQEPQKLESNKPVEREIAGGESHIYQISLTEGQFVHFRLDQRAIDSSMGLSAPDGKPLVGMNLTTAGDYESLSHEAATTGSYRLLVRGAGLAALHGSYRLVATVQATATAQDRKRMAAEALSVEAFEHAKQGARTAVQVIEKLEQSQTLWRELGDSSWVAYSLLKIGIAYGSLNRSDKAIEYLEKSLAIYREVGNRSGESNAISNLGTINGSISQMEKAVGYFEQELVIYRELQDRRAEGRVLGNLGLGYMFLAQYEKALEYLQQGLLIVREIKDQFHEGRNLVSMGIVYEKLGRYETSIEYFEQALQISRAVKDQLGVGNTLMTLGNTYFQVNRGEKAIEYYDQALSIFREIKYRIGEGNTLITLGNIYSNLSQNEKAVDYYEQALAIFREVKFRNGEATALNNLGNSNIKLKHPEKAVEYLEQSVAICREVKNRRGEGAALARLGAALRDLGKLEQSMAVLTEALTITRAIGDLSFEASALNSQAVNENLRGNMGQAQRLIEESLQKYESLRRESGSPESRAAIFASAQEAFQFYTDVLMRQHKAEPTKGFDAIALEASERQRTRVLLDRLTEARVDLREGVDAALVEREHSLGKQLNDKAQRLMQANKPEQVAALKQEISQLETDYERAQANIRKASPRYAALAQPQPLKLKEIQALLDADILLLEYALGKESSFLWAITRDSLTSYELPKGELIEKDARQVYEMLSARSTTKRGESALQRQERIAQAEAQLPAAALALSRTLLAPVAQQLGNKRLVIVADGALQYIPFAMLADPSVVSRQSSVAKSNGQPLIVNHEVISLSSASALAIQRTELAGRQPAPKMLAVIADPVFDRSDVRFTTPVTNDKAQTPTIAFNDSRSIEHLADKSDNKSDDKSGTTTRQLVIPRLPFTRQEATRLLALVPKISSFAAMDFQASNATVLKSDLSQYRYVHFATHGLVDTERPGLSSLVLSMVDAEGKPQDGFLRLKDIYNLKLPAELVVLSACQTGLGKEIKGEGMEALTRGFMYAGAARIVVSLWSVNDKATADLMTRFYKKMLKQGDRPAAALRAAQVEMWRQKQWQSPYYWAAFTIQGEWR